MDKLLLILSLSTALNAASWQDESNQFAEAYTKELSKIVPELGSSLGYSEFDSRGMIIGKDSDQKIIDLMNKWETKINEKLKSKIHPELKLDLQVMRTMLQNESGSIKLNIKYHDSAFTQGSKDIYTYLQMLINPQSPAKRKKAAVDRFKVYVNGSKTQKPFLEACRLQTERRTKDPKKALFPIKNQVEQYLKNSPAYLKGIKDLLENSGRKDWQKDYKKFESQLNSYDAFVKDKILPKARTNFQLPKEIYVHVLKTKGIDTAPDILIHAGKDDYQRMYKQFREYAKLVASKHKLKKTDPVSVINFLKKDQVSKPKEVKKLYETAAKTLKEIITKHKIVSLPKEPLKIRLAGDAESKATPVPHLKPPPLVGNKGQRPEFVVPTSTTGKLPFDDFSFKAAALVLTAHEGRPGHDLQFSTMLDNGVTIIRARYAYNPVNTEGWGLYAEDLVFNYLPIESQLIAIQTRLWRVARSFLDPQLQLGQIKDTDVINLFTKELGVSPVLAKAEADRYAFRDVGQAPAYYYGLKKVLKVKFAAERIKGSKFKLKCFNDAVLANGLIPLDLVEKKLTSDLRCNAMSH